MFWMSIIILNANKNIPKAKSSARVFSALYLFKISSNVSKTGFILYSTRSFNNKYENTRNLKFKVIDSSCVGYAWRIIRHYKQTKQKNGLT